MEKHSVTVIIKGQPYGLIITVNPGTFETVYEVVPDIRAYVLEDFQPQYPTFTADHTDTVEKRIRIVETEQIARIIWQEILNKMDE
ncbi:hypothetical protein [Chitinophaga nivalis]|uniref:Phage protein n=1 Tax=Chitinophaga nivalis TaxID=2991709 RepID=A0ABT3ILI8_9BACT|nr:hypothetical protein [Chitinophaga nivalis]MCW3465482.1 hypothetical protein [Chitinophaga nivalis]MCW3484827.1 hypothetical protein [Chitinophaga nivalis]